jgi:hypothetical protein
MSRSIINSDRMVSYRVLCTTVISESHLCPARAGSSQPFTLNSYLPTGRHSLPFHTHHTIKVEMLCENEDLDYVI